MTREDARRELTQAIADLRLGKAQLPFEQGGLAGRLTTVLDAYEDLLDDLTAHCDQQTVEIGELEEKLDTDETALIEMVCQDERSGITGTDN